MKLTRREFIRTAGMAAGAAFLLPQLELRSFTAFAQTDVGERWVATGCVGCVGWCPLKVRVVNGRAVKITGNENSAWTEGRLCPRGMLNLQNLYDPDRIKAPLKRTNAQKGRDQDPGWVEISWDEALNTIAEKLGGLRERGTPERFAVFRGRYDTLSSDILYSRLPRAFGTPNAISHSALCAETTKAGNWMAQGRYAYSSYDLEDSKYILSFGVTFLEAHRPLSGMMAAWSRSRRDQASKPRLVVVDPRYSVTATRADEWLPINPGTDGALALGLAHEILVNGLWDRAFVGDFRTAGGRFVAGQAVAEEDWEDAYTTGLVKWWNLFLKDFTAEKAAVETGIPADTIKRIARDFATTRPAITLRGRGSEAWPGNGSYNSYAIFVLNGLVGSIETKGGVNHYPSISYSSDPIPVVQDDAAKAGAAKPRIDERGTRLFPRADVVTNNAADNILRDYPYPIEVVLGFWNNFTFSAPGSRRWEAALAKVPFVVHHTTHISEWSMYSDIVLPASTHIERWAAGHPAGGASLYSGMTLYQPAVAPLFDAKSEIDFGIALGKKLGERYPSIRESFEGVGGTYGDTAEGYTRARTERQWSAMPGGWEEFKQAGTANAGPYKFTREFSTPSKKFEFFSGNLKRTFEEKGVSDSDLATYRIQARGDTVFVPHYQPPIFVGDVAAYPLTLISYKNILSQEGRSANAPWTQEVFLSPMYGSAWTNFAEINSETARSYGIADGDKVRVESEIGSIEAVAKLSEGVHPGVVAICFGQGHWAYGRWAKDRGSNPNEITGVTYDHITGMSAYYNTRVRVAKA